MKKKLFMLVCSVLVLALALTACGKKDEPAPATDAPATEATATEAAATEATATEAAADLSEEISINDWEGTWNNMGAYLDMPEVEEGFAELAKNEGVSVEEAKEAYKEKRRCDFDGLVVADGKVTFLEGFKDDGAKEIETVEYEFVESVEVTHGSHQLTWDVFAAKGEATYPVLLMMPVHGEEALTHFHLRYGADKEELLGKEGWYPTFVKPSSTFDQLNEEIAE